MTLTDNSTHLQFYAFLRDYAASSELIKARGGELHFFRGEADEFYNGLRDRCSFPCIVAEGFSNDYSGLSGTCYKERSTAFAVVDSYIDTEDWDQRDGAFARCEAIGDDILRLLAATYKSRNCILGVDGISCIQVENRTERWAGLRWEFTIKSYFPL